MSTPKLVPTAPATAAPPIAEDLDPATITCLTRLAAALRAGNEPEADRATRTLLTWLGDPLIALRAAAALIDPHSPVDRWWDNPADRPCQRCGRPITAAGNRRYHPLCQDAQRREYWRERNRRRSATTAPTSEES